MKILVGTKNPGKIKGATEAILPFYPNAEIIGIAVESNVSEQPISEETLTGAKNRVNNLIKYATENNIKADYFMAIESGLCEIYGDWQIVNFAVIKDKNGYESIGTSAGFPVPTKYIESIKSEGFGDVIDKLLQTSDTRNSIGGISYLTHNQLTRIDLTKDAFTMALTKFVNGNLWKD